MSPTRLPRWSARTGRWPLAFPVLLFPSGPLPAPRSTWNHVQAQGSAPEIPRRPIFLATVTCSREDGDSLDSCQVGGGDYGRLGLGDKLQFSALLWPSRADSGILFLHGGQREPGIPGPHEPGHIRERLKEVRATHARAKKSGPLTPPRPNHPRWRA